MPDRIADEIRGLSRSADRLLDRGRALRVRAGKARLGWTRWILMALAHHLERKGSDQVRQIIILRKAQRALGGKTSGHRAARRAAFRDNGQ